MNSRTSFLNLLVSWFRGDDDAPVLGLRQAAGRLRDAMEDGVSWQLCRDLLIR